MWNITRPPIIGILSLTIGIILHFIFPIVQVFYFPYNLTVGIIFILIGILIAGAGRIAFEKTKTPITPKEKPTKLITNAIYKHTRNPMYLGLLIILIGISTIFGSLSSFIAPILFFLFINFSFIPYEEKFLENIFGKQYREYKKKVRRWI